MLSMLDGDLVAEEPRSPRSGVSDQGLLLGQFQLEIVMQEPRQAPFDLFGLGFGSGEPEQMIICVPAVPQPPVAGIARIPGGQAAQFPPQRAHLDTVTAFASLRDRALHLLILRVVPAEFPSGVFRYENCFDEIVQPVQVNIGQDW